MPTPTDELYQLYDDVASVRRRMSELNSCGLCPEPVAPNDVIVLLDDSGCEGLASTPAHLECYLNCADPTLPSNDALRKHCLKGIALGRVPAECLDGDLTPEELALLSPPATTSGS